MFGSAIIDFALSICFIFFLMSIVASTIMEAFNAVIHGRNNSLKKQILAFVGPKLYVAIRDNPAIRGLAPRPGPVAKMKGYVHHKKGSGTLVHDQMPTYIPSDVFALTLLAAIQQQAVDANTPPSDVSSLRTTAATYASTVTDGNSNGAKNVSELINTLSLQAPTMPALLDAIAKWFDGAMSRLSGQYKRGTQMWLFVVGFGIAVVWNANALRMADQLWNSTSARVVAQSAATAVAGIRPDATKGVPPSQKEANDAATKAMRAAANLSLPIGWDHKQDVKDPYFTALPNSIEEFEDRGMVSVLGWIVTALMISLGAPFWFDLLNKVSDLRVVGSKPQTANAQKPPGV